MDGVKETLKFPLPKGLKLDDAPLADGGAAIQFAGRQRELEAFLVELEPHGVREIVRTGAVALRTGAAPGWN